MEERGGESVLGREPALPIGCLGARRTHRQDPDRVAVLLVQADSVSRIGSAGEARSDRLGESDPPPPISAMHEVDEPPTGRELRIGEHDVVRRAAEDSIADAHRVHPPRPPTRLYGAHSRRNEVTTADRRQNVVAGRNRLDRDLAGRRAHHRARRETLVGVTDDEHPPMTGGQQHHHLVLDVIGVLILVDEHMLEALPVVREHVVVVLQQLDGLDQQIVEIHRARPQQAQLGIRGTHRPCGARWAAAPALRTRRRRCRRSSMH